MCFNKQTYNRNTAMNYTRKFYMCLLKILKVILRRLWSVLILVLFIVFYQWNNYSTITVKVISNHPVIVWWTLGFPGTQDTIHCTKDIKCDIFSSRNVSKFDIEAYLFYGSVLNFHDLPLPRRSNNVLWGLYHEESPRNNEELMHEQMLSLFNYSSTYSRHSSVPFPLQHLESFKDITSTIFFVKTLQKNDLLEEISPVLYIQSDCETSTERDAYVKKLMKYIKVDSYGDCLRNKELPSKFKEDYLNNLNDDDFLQFIARYKFVVAIENGVCEDYVTEKFWRAIKVGSVPIYFGSPSISYWHPNSKSAILLQDYPTPELLSVHLNKLLENDSLYEEYLDHKIKGVITNERLLEEFKTRSYQINSIETVRKFECFICNRLFDKRVRKLGVNVVGKSHYNCPKPLSALTLGVNPSNDWVYSWERAKASAEILYKTIIES